MKLKSIFRDFIARVAGRDSKTQPIEESCLLGCRNIQFSPKESPSQESIWANMPPELLLDIISRIEAEDTAWPWRRSVVSCAGVCKNWRSITMELTRTPEQCGLFTFPMSLKQPGPRDSPVQCYIRRDRTTSTYQLYLGLSPALAGDSSKFLLAAKKIRKATKTDFVISLSANDFSQTSETYAGRLRSNFLGSKFFIHDCQIQTNPTFQSCGWSWKKISTNRVSPRPPVCSYNVASISYELNVLRTRGPRRMRCVMNTIPASSTQQGASVPLINAMPSLDYDGMFSPFSIPSIAENSKDSLVLENKVPRWHDQLQCWCLNFRGRVTIASVKNFQLVAATDTQSSSASDDERVILQFGKIGKDIFTMDYQYPLSAFQAFAICLSSFDTKPACE